MSKSGAGLAKDAEEEVAKEPEADENEAKELDGEHVAVAEANPWAVSASAGFSSDIELCAWSFNNSRKRKYRQVTASASFAAYRR